MVHRPGVYRDEAYSKPAHADPAYAALKFTPPGNDSATRHLRERDQNFPLTRLVHTLYIQDLDARHAIHGQAFEWDEEKAASN